MRNLNDEEKFLIESILPLKKPGYKRYREIISNFKVVSEKKEENGVILLLSENPAEQNFLSPVFALGSAVYEGKEYYILIHELFENSILIEIQLTGNSNQNKNGVKWTLSDWQPGMGKNIREVHLIKNKIVLAIDSGEKRIWCYDARTGVNHIIPVTNFYNEIMRVKGIKDPALTLNSGRLFTHLTEFTDREIGQGFLLYNKYLNKIELDYSLFSEKKEKAKKRGFIFNSVFVKKKSTNQSLKNS